MKKIDSFIQQISPLNLALDWDNVGLLVGSWDKDVKKALLTIDITADVLTEARNCKADLILSYHPVIWEGLKNVTAGGESDIVYQLLKYNINVYSIHTAFDIVKGGTNDLLAEILGLEQTRPVGDYVPNPAGDCYKLTTFIPFAKVNAVAEALFKAGAGAIGNYSHCSYRSSGQGTFMPLEGSNPAIGEKNKLQYVDEIRLEAMVKADKINQVIAALRKAHPYETPAFDVVLHRDTETVYGLGRTGRLSRPMKIPEILENIKNSTLAKTVGLIGPMEKTVKTAAVCAGSCGKIISRVIADRCDLYLTGELKHHHALAAREANLTCICLSHTVSERFALKNLASRLKEKLEDVELVISKQDKDPFIWKEI